MYLFVFWPVYFRVNLQVWAILRVIGPVLYGDLQITLKSLIPNPKTLLPYTHIPRKLEPETLSLTHSLNAAFIGSSYTPGSPPDKRC